MIHFILLAPILAFSADSNLELSNPNYQKPVTYRAFSEQCTDFIGKKHDAMKAFDDHCKSLGFKGLSQQKEHIKEMQWDIKSTSEGCATNPNSECKIHICSKKIRCIENN